MPDPKGARLFVNLGPSQARRRLRGFGHGVRKVQSAGRNRAVIIHTATGRHLLELEAKFADVGCSNTESGLSHSAQNQGQENTETADQLPEDSPTPRAGNSQS